MISIWISILVLPVIFFLDLWIKNRIERDDSLGDGEKRGADRSLLNGRLLIKKHHNRGAVLNFGQEKRALVAAVSVGMTLILTLIFILSLGHLGNGALRVGLALVLGGAFSNTYDRLRRKYVVDYVSFGVRWKRLRRVVFNVSDFFIIIGALVAALGAAVES